MLPPRSDRVLLIREAFRLEWLTIGWMTIEAVVSIAAGLTADSLVVLAFGLAGLIVALVAIPAMRYLAHRKITIAEKIGSRALRADAMEAVTCGWLSFVVVISLAAQWLAGVWWIDSIGSLAIVWFLIKEGRGAWSGKDCCC